MAQKQNGPARYTLYLRCSTDDQKEGDFTTVQVQEELNRSYVATMRGTVAGVYRDEGISGTTLKRPDWQRLLADAQAGCFDSVGSTSQLAESAFWQSTQE